MTPDEIGPEFHTFFRVCKRPTFLSVRKIGSGAIGEEDVVGWIEGQREGVVGDGGGEIQGIER